MRKLTSQDKVILFFVTGEFSEAEACYHELFELTKIEIRKQNIKSIQERLEEIGKKFNLNYDKTLDAYLTLLTDDQKKLILKDYPRDDLKKINGLYLTRLILQSEGLSDLFALEHEAIVSRIKNKDFSIESPFINLIARIHLLSETDLPILIIGETGTSKGLISKAIHKISKRWDQRYLEINCTAFPENLIESELFGYSKGAFTGAIKDKKGVLELANNGTLFLDELGKMPSHYQVKLLKAIEEQKILPLGSEKEVPVNVRILAAAHPKNIRDEGDNDIIDDLLYRLGYPDVINMPNLNLRFNSVRETERAEVLKKILDNMAKKMDAGNLWISTAAKKILSNSNYVGNYRELENILRHGIILATIRESKVIKTQDLPKMKPIPQIDIKVSDKIDKPVGSQLAIDTSGVLLKDIFEYSDKIKSMVIENKILETLRMNNDIKPTLMREGLAPNQYTNFWRKVRTFTKKSIKDFKKQLLN
jgi:transcriptional regulator with PAS, ATPase and Fis domain